MDSFRLYFSVMLIFRGPLQREMRFWRFVASACAKREETLSIFLAFKPYLLVTISMPPTLHVDRPRERYAEATSTRFICYTQISSSWKESD